MTRSIVLAVDVRPGGHGRRFHRGPVALQARSCARGPAGGAVTKVPCGEARSALGPAGRAVVCWCRRGARFPARR